ncbi:B-cell receptor CD22-like [Neolamprologus brichardi]|uniref:B-cell receptor CD22-like n=1 Tax=Neolamprologus brichardi TaxID=32507 RepID=UPI0016437FF0|nr:B-cell receptor CD22-like [Neolamprologus brichardi]
MLNVKVWTTTIMPFRNVCRLFVGVIIYITGVNGGQTRICDLKGSSVDLHCSHQHLTSSRKWFTIQWKGNYVQSELSVDGQRVTYNMSEEKNPTLTINDLRESDANAYCCMTTTDSPQLCWLNRITLQVVTELQVKVIPATEGQTVTLMCSSSCPLTEKPAAYIWYKNREFLYEDWSPWYQELISSEEAVTYSCAVKGYEDLRAPEVSVDSITSTCFNVTYTKSEMCPYQQGSEHEPCSITFPRVVHVVRTPGNTLTCSTSCPLIDPQTVYVWYENGKLYRENIRSISIPSSLKNNFYCAIKGHEHLQSDEVCVQDKNCWRVNYVSRRICALEGSSVNIISKYSHPDNVKPEFKLWISELRVKMSPSAVVTEGQRVTLTCSTSCPLTDNTNYIWYLNSRPLTPRENQNKHLILDPVSREDAGSYSCAVKTNTDISSAPKTLTVQSITGTWTPAAAGGSAALLVLIPLTVCWCRRKKRTSSQSPRQETSDNKQVFL